MDFYKGPITSCEYLNNNSVLIGCGPYLTLIKEENFEEISKYLALKYRVIHKIVKSNHNPNLICVFGQKAFNIVKLNESSNEFTPELETLIELDDWIFDIYWYQVGSNIDELYLIIICAHNQCVLFNLNKKKVDKVIYCDQKCMLYSGKIIDFNEIESDSKQLNNIIIASGTIYNQILLWSALNGSIYVKLDGHQGVIFNISFQKNFLFSVSDDRSINVWKLEVEMDNVTNKGIQIKNSDLYTRFYGHDARVWKCACLIDKKTNIEYAISIGEDLNCCLWNLNEKILVYRFKAMRKGSKNIWSLCVNEDKLEIITGWADGGLRKFELKNYITRPDNDLSIDSSSNGCSDKNALDQIEWNLNNPIEKDYIRDVLLVNERIICCTNLGCLYSIETNFSDYFSGQPSSTKSNNQKLLFKSELLSNYNVMTKIKLNGESKNWCVAIGTLKGFIYVLDLKQSSDMNNDEIKIECFNCLSIEKEIKCSDLNNGSSTKICNLILHEFKQASINRYFLIACFGFMNGLMHLYELVAQELVLIARLHLPEAKHRWLSSFAIITTNQEDLIETIHLSAGDKCGNLYLYKVESKSLNLVEPVQALKNMTKQNAAVSSIYAKALNEELSSFLVICCCKDGFYRVFEFDLQDQENQNETTELKLINKYQINSYVDLLESFIFDEDLTNNNFENESPNFELESRLRLALCFYGDKFLLWNFHLNRALFEFKCGGANRSWDYELIKSDEASKEDTFLFRFIYVKNKSMCEFSKILSNYEVKKPFNQSKNHFCQIYHGNTITTCKYLRTGKYLLTGGEDTQLILSEIADLENPTRINLFHQFHLQGHESVVKCIAYCDLNETEILLVSAGGKANIKIWKLLLDENLGAKKIVHLYDFKIIKQKKETTNGSGIKEKPWLYVDLKSNPEIRFMDATIFRNENSEIDFTVCFCCSDGAVRVFKYNMESNKLYLINKFSYPKCLLCMKYLVYKRQPYLFCFGTDGHLLAWKIDENQNCEVDNKEISPERIQSLHQSGINAVDIWKDKEMSGNILIGTVGDDTRLNVITLDLNKDFSDQQELTLTKEMAHASSIVGIKFLKKHLLATVSKDQRLIIWKLNFEDKTISCVKVIFINVADASSMDMIEIKPNMFKVSIAGVGIEIIHINLDLI